MSDSVHLSSSDVLLFCCSTNATIENDRPIPVSWTVSVSTRMKWSFEGKWIAGGLGLTLLLMGCVSFASYRNTLSMTESTQRVQRTYKVLNRLSDLYAEMSIAESGRRGYVFLKDDRELGRYQIAVSTMRSQMQAVQQEMGMASIQQQRLQQLIALVNQRLALLQRSIQLYQANPAAIQTQRSMTEQSVQLRTQIQNTLTAIKTEEEQSLKESLDRAQTDVHVKTVLELVGTLLSFAVIIGVCGILYRQQIQRQRVQSLEWTLAQEKELSELKLRFFSMVSHEFRTPLSVILASSQLLKEILLEVVDAGKLKNLHRIQASARLMSRLLTDILTLTRAEAGKLDYQPEPLDVEAFCLNLVEDLLFGEPSQHSIKFASQGYCTRVNLDEKLLYSILSNLLLNAIKYSPQGGDICLILTCEPERTLFEVKDQGIGIPVADQSRIFEPFYRGSNTGTIVGSGLGLATVKKCLELHQGEIRVESEVGIGTTFTAIIPRQ